MLHRRSELPQSFEQCNVAMQRYLQMFANERKEIAKLKWHEKDFLFQNMRSLFDNQGNSAFDLLDIAEAEDYVMCLLILMFASDAGIIDFKKEVRSFYGCQGTGERHLRASFLPSYTMPVKAGISRICDVVTCDVVTFCPISRAFYKIMWKKPDQKEK